MCDQDMPANPVLDKTGHVKRIEDLQCNGETKREKAFWQVYSAMLSNKDCCRISYDDIASKAIYALKAGFDALEDK